MANEKRLIDANEALRMMRNSKADNPCTDIIRKGAWNVAHDCAISCVDACPTVDAVEVVHGMWQERRFICMDSEVMLGYRCSKCKLTFDVGTNYCPNCGADMRERKDNV